MLFWISTFATVLLGVLKLAAPEIGLTWLVVFAPTIAFTIWFAFVMIFIMLIAIGALAVDNKAKKKF